MTMKPRNTFLPHLSRREMILGLVAVATGGGAVKAATPRPFSFQPYLRVPRTLNVHEVRVRGGNVTLSAGDPRRPATPFTFDWGDGTRTEGFFPATHVYEAVNRNYEATVTAHYGTFHQTVPVRVRFIAEKASFTRDPKTPKSVQVARQRVALVSTTPLYEPPADLVGFDDKALAMPRELLEYLLDVAHAILLDLCNHDIDPAVGLEQVILGAPSFGGGFSLWYTKPMSLGASPVFLSQCTGLSPLLHEVAHNLTLNFPAKFRFGGKIDGPMSTIISETLAQILGHAAAWEILNRPGRYGLPAWLCDELENSVVNSFGILVNLYLGYVAGRCPYATVQRSGAQGSDPTVGTFMTAAYQFFRYAEVLGTYREPVKRMMKLLQTFREDDRRRYQEPNNERFRATFVVAALSYGLQRDLRADFRALRFPVDDALFAEMLGRTPGRPATP